MILSVNKHSSIQIVDLFFDPFKIEDEAIATFNTETNDFGTTNLIAEHRHARVVFLTHTHFDHLSPADLKQIVAEGTVFVAPKSAGEQLDKLFPNHKKYLMSVNEELEIDGIKIHSQPAYNVDKPFHPRSNNWLGYQLEIEGKRLAVLGDTDHTKELDSVNCDILFVPIGGTYTMDAAEAAKLTNIISPKIVVPVHYNDLVGDKTDEAKFKKTLDSAINCVILVK